MQGDSTYGVALVQQIEAKYPLSPRVHEAFLRVPRHAFLTPREDVKRGQWLSEVYQDTAVVTKLDQRGMPLSSSSQLSAMAWMLEGSSYSKPNSQFLKKKFFIRLFLLFMASHQ